MRGERGRLTTSITVPSTVAASSTPLPPGSSRDGVLLRGRSCLHLLFCPLKAFHQVGLLYSQWILFQELISDLKSVGVRHDQTKTLPMDGV